METDIKIATQKFIKKEYSEFRNILKLHPDFINTAGQMWFDRASSKNDIEALSCLYEIGFDLNQEDHTGTPLSNAASDGAIQIVKWLLSHGAKIDTRNITNNPLFSAIQCGHPELVKLFLDLGVDPKIVYPCGRNALTFAREWGNKEIIMMLGGDPTEKRTPWVNTALPDLTGKRLTHQILAKIETELNLKFPEYFKEFIKNNFPEKLYFPDAKDNDDWQWLGQDYLLFHTARSFIAYNCDNPQLENKKRLYPGFIAFGTNGGGDFWCIKESDDDRTVYIYDHELEKFETTSTSFEAYIEEIVTAPLSKTIIGFLTRLMLWFRRLLRYS